MATTYDATYTQTFSAIRNNVASGIKENWSAFASDYGYSASQDPTEQQVFAVTDQLMQSEGDYVTAPDGKLIPTFKTADELAQRTAKGVDDNAPSFRNNFFSTLMTYLGAAFTWLVENIGGLFTGKPGRSFSEIVADSVTPKMQTAIGNSLTEMSQSPQHQEFFQQNPDLITTIQSEVATGVRVQAGIESSAPTFSLNNVNSGAIKVQGPQFAEGATAEQKVEGILQSTADAVIAGLPAGTDQATLDAVREQMIASGKKVATDSPEKIKNPKEYVSAILDDALPQLKSNTALDQKMVALLEKPAARNFVEQQLVNTLLAKTDDGKTMHGMLLEATGQQLSAEEQERASASAQTSEQKKQDLRQQVYSQTYEQTHRAIDQAIMVGIIEQSNPPLFSWNTLGGIKFKKDVITGIQKKADDKNLTGTARETFIHDSVVQYVDQHYDALMADQKTRQEYEAARAKAEDLKSAPNEAQRIAVAHTVAHTTQDVTFDPDNAHLSQEQLARKISDEIREAMQTTPGKPGYVIDHQTATQFSSPVEFQGLDMLTLTNPQHTPTLQTVRHGLSSGFMFSAKDDKGHSMVDDLATGAQTAIMNDEVYSQLSTAQQKFSQISVAAAATTTPTPEDPNQARTGPNGEFIPDPSPALQPNQDEKVASK